MFYKLYQDFSNTVVEFNKAVYFRRSH